MSNTKLLPCPFCGGEARPWQNSENLYWIIQCTKCVATAGDHVDVAGAAKAWNTRHKPSEPAAASSRASDKGEAV